jgi:hypothetical protein
MPNDRGTCCEVDREHFLADKSSPETLPPWSQHSNWSFLLRQVLIMSKSLEGRSRLNRLNTSAHSREPTAAHYFNMHIARLLCLVFLHWEFLPFLPLRCRQPTGPDPAPQHAFQAKDAPPAFWRSSARECFSAAKAILDLASDAREESSLAVNALAAYGIFVAKFIQIYASAFPWMDPDRVITPSHVEPPTHQRLNTTEPPAGRLQTYSAELQGAETITTTAQQWAEDLDTIAIYFETFKSDFVNNTSENLPAPRYGNYQSTKCLRDGGDGDGREEYELFRHRLVDFGDL